MKKQILKYQNTPGPLKLETETVPTGITDQITFNDDGAWLHLPNGEREQLTSKDMGEYFALSNGKNIWRVPKEKLKDKEPQNAAQRLGEWWRKSPAYGFDKVMLGTLAMSAVPQLAVSTIFNPVSTALGIGGYEIGSKATDNLMERFTGKNWGDYMQDNYYIPKWFSGLIKPGGIIGGGFGSMAGQVYDRAGKIAIDNLTNQLRNSATKQVAQETAQEITSVPWHGQNGYYITPQIRNTNVSPAENYAANVAPDGYAIPEGYKFVKMSGGRHVVSKDGKQYIAEVINKNNSGNGYGYNRNKVAELAKEEFGDETTRPFLHRQANEDNTLADALDQVQSGTSETKFATGESTLAEPEPHSVLTGTYWDLKTGRPITRGVGYLGTKPIPVTATEGTYGRRGKFGDMVSVTNNVIGGGKYGFRNYDELENFLLESDLNSEQLGYVEEILNRIKTFEEGLTLGPETTNGLIPKGRRSLETYEQYLRDQAELSDFLSGNLNFGAKNQRVVYKAPYSRQIVSTNTTGQGLSTNNKDFGLDLQDFFGRPFNYFRSPNGKTIPRKTWPSGMKAEEQFALYNSDPQYKYLILSSKYNPNLLFPLHFRGVGPNPFPGMTTMQVTGVRPTFKKGGRIMVTNNRL